MAKKTISDVLAYLYRNKKFELAEAVIEELRRPAVTPVTPTPRPFTTPITPIFSTPTPPTRNPHTITGNPDGWMGPQGSTVDKTDENKYPTITK